MPASAALAVPTRSRAATARASSMVRRRVMGHLLSGDDGGGLLAFAAAPVDYARAAAPSIVAATGHAVAWLCSAAPCRRGKEIGDGVEAC
jgi:hypothetical protein